jgi:Fe-S oxidoreductase
MMMAKKADRSAWASGLKLKFMNSSSAPVLYHVGCRTSFDPELQKLARITVDLLNTAGIDFMVAGSDESCCGGRAYEMGYQGELIKFAEHNIQNWKSNNIKTVVTACSDCFAAFKVDYYKLGFDHPVEILHITQFLERLLEEGKLKPKAEVPLTVAYHDPCHLGRKSEPSIRWSGVERKVMGQLVLHSPIKEYRRGTYGIYESPRSVLKSIPGLKLVEMERIKEYAWCCGAGGGVIEAFPDFALWSAQERIVEAKAAGARALVTACPWCERNFNDALKSNGKDFGVYDILEIVANSCIGGK